VRAKPGSTPATSPNQPNPFPPTPLAHLHTPAGQHAQTPDQPQTSRRPFARVTHTQSNVMRSVINQSGCLDTEREKEIKSEAGQDKNKASLVLHPPFLLTCRNQARYPSNYLRTTRAQSTLTEIMTRCRSSHPPVPQASDSPPPIRHSYARNPPAQDTHYFSRPSSIESRAQ
jgi:hypothetical protein